MIEPKPVQYSPRAPAFSDAFEATDVRKILGERAHALQCACPENTPTKPTARENWLAGLTPEDRDLFEQVCGLGTNRNHLYTQICRQIGEELKAEREANDQANRLDGK